MASAPSSGLVIGRRELVEVTFSNSYEGSLPFQQSAKLHAIVFNYRFNVTLPGWKSSSELFEGKAIAYEDPSDGRLKLISLELPRDHPIAPWELPTKAPKAASAKVPEEVEREFARKPGSTTEPIGEKAAASCLAGDAIEPTRRTAATDAALAFYDRLLNSDATARDALTDEAKKLVAHDVFVKMMRTIASNGPYRDVALQRTFQPNIVGAPGRVTCDGDGAPETVSLSALPGAVQIHTLFTAKTRNNDWSLTAWMIEKDRAWRVHAFYVSMASIVGHTAPDILRIAEGQTQKGHAFNAHLLYAVAKNLADRGPNIDLAVTQEINAALAKQEAPPELKGAPPFQWKLEGTTFPVEFVALVGADKKLGLNLVHRDPSWDGKDTGKAERRNQRLIDGFVRSHPEYKEVFSYISARILQPGKDTGWGTVFDAAKGYETGEPSITKVKPK